MPKNPEQLNMQQESLPDQPEQTVDEKKNSLYEAGNQRREALLSGAKNKWQRMKNWLREKAVAGTNYALAAPEAAKIAGSKFTEKAAVGVEKIATGTDKVAGAVINAPGRIANAGMEMGSRAAQGIEGAAGYIRNKFSEEHEALRQQGKEAYGNLRNRVSNAKNRFRDKINSYRDRALLKTLAVHEKFETDKFIEAQSEANALRNNLERIKAMRARVVKRLEGGVENPAVAQGA
ncbi:MAG: hypothetical protein PHP25_04085 [Candidatus Moranbacteria bacterium]|nr:hypothetical protein [Candidatus Moranbacteria bacterium]